MKFLKFLWYFLCWPGYITLFLRYLNPVEWSKTRNVAKTARHWRFRHILAPLITAIYAFLLFGWLIEESDSSYLSKDEEPQALSLPLIDKNENPLPPSSPPPSATAIQNIIPAVFHGEHSDGPRLWDISARSLVNYDGGKYIVKEVVLADGGKICVVTVKSPTEQDVITLRQTSKGKIIVTSRMLDDEWQRYEEEGGEAPD